MQIAAAEDEVSFSEAVEPLINILDFIGALPLASKLDNKDHLVAVLCKHITVRRMQGFLDQYVIFQFSHNFDNDEIILIIYEIVLLENLCDL